MVALCIALTTACRQIPDTPNIVATLPPPRVSTVPLRPSATLTLTLVPTFTPTQTPLPLPTLDYSTPAPPANDWATYTDENSGISFKYPANWFLSAGDIGDGAIQALIQNAPPNSVVSIKGYADDLIKLHIKLAPITTEPYGSLKAFIDSTILNTLPPERLVSAEELPTLPQGYTAFRLTTLGLGESLTLYVANKNNLITLSTSYAPGKRSDKKYLDVMEQIAGTLVIP